MPCSRRAELIRALLGAATLALTLGGCGDGAESHNARSLTGRTFSSDRAMDGDAPHPLVAGTQIRLTFHDDGRLTASAGCNLLAAQVIAGPERLRVGDMSTTEMGCDPARHAQDQWLADLLGADPSYELEGRHLRLRSGTTSIELTAR